MDGSTELELEKELEDHTQEQRESLNAIDEALALDPSNDELLLMKEELMGSLKAAEHNLFQLKRARLLVEIDAMAHSTPSSPRNESRPANDGERGCEHTKGTDEGDDVAERGFDAERDEQKEELGQNFLVGSKCRFPHTNGLWYNGIVVTVDESGLARISFLSPTVENMQMCRFYLSNRCRFGGNCRQSHGVELPLYALRSFIPTQWESTSVGSRVLACDANVEGSGLWRHAELESLDESRKRASVVFISDGKKADVDFDDVALSEHAELSDGSETSDSEEEVGSDDEAKPRIAQALQTETLIFADWEKHTRGVASRMMANMGFKEGMGLGKSGQGQVDPIEVKILPPKQSLGYVDETKRAVAVKSGKNVNGKDGTKKKTRGGKRKRAKKWAAAALLAKTEREQAPDVFGFINQQLAHQFDPQSRERSEKRENGSERKARKEEDRHSIIAHGDDVIEIRNKIGKLEEMARRNRHEKAVYDGVNRRLQEARKALRGAEAAHASATNAVRSQEEEKKWLRF